MSIDTLREQAGHGTQKKVERLLSADDVSAYLEQIRGEFIVAREDREKADVLSRALTGFATYGNHNPNLIDDVSQEKRVEFLILVLDFLNEGEENNTRYGWMREKIKEVLHLSYLPDNFEMTW